MGEHQIKRQDDPEDIRVFTQKLLTDIEVLSRMIEGEVFETGLRRIGAEQEMFLVDRDGRAAPVADEVLAAIDDPHFTHELALFNMECNLDPLVLETDCLSRFEAQLVGLVDKARKAAEAQGYGVVLTGILPTLEASDLTLDNVTPEPRYRALNDAILRLRRGPFDIRVKGFDEVILRADSVMFEASNTSFQVHFQVVPDEFARLYNVAQAVSAPVLAAATNSPLLFGKRLWRETRIALFQQSIDTRQPTSHVREQNPRVSFGRRWVDDSVLEVLREDVSRLRVILSTEIDEDSRAELDAGRIPRLQALGLYNGTVYRWNRPVYGISDGKPHLRIENRILPSGPTPADEMANAAFWFGLMRAVAEEHGDISRVMTFETAEANFLAAARLGLQAQFTWPGRPSAPAQDLILQELLPLAREGLDDMGITSADTDRYLGIVEERVESQQTGSQWMIESLVHMGDEGTKAERLAALTLATMERQRANRPIHEWPPASLAEAGGWEKHYSKVRHFMITELFTVHENELVDLVAALMDWEHIRHVPVEDDRHRLVGLVTHRTLLRLLAQGRIAAGNPIPVSEIMHRELITIRPDTPTLEAIRLMKEHRVGCLPVVDDEDRLIGIITERDFLGMSAQLLEEGLARAE
jgi:CBS domain-containing protein/gamma-glutamyl:cysteine ligase YbdK (ATP-grasp superfamily)